MSNTTAEVYTISHPISKEIFYVGSTKDVAMRTYTHMLDSNTSKVSKYIKQLRGDNIEPVFSIIDSCDWLNQYEVEMKWIIHFFDAKQPLLNRQVSKLTKGYLDEKLPITINISKDILFDANEKGKMKEGFVKYVSFLIEKDLES